ncbi:CBS domain-containing protein [Prauserella cavernicola]|uniref:CBS domain-containing protein n=1 Tax=Prauserella cavernicola TaxID=2800127 RepID=A0A934V335_9PSEU|nr:CBS domain-containing protein [Prauserella cavernicola]MBK1783174.1 CBS domain-containing protein [Prauserella cavernicola]
MRASDVMTAPVVTVERGTPVKAAANTLARNGFSALPVVDGDSALLGVVTEADLVRDRFPRDARHPRGGERRAAGSTVGEVMTAPAVAVGTATDVVDVVRLMLDERVRSVPVTRGRRLVGILTRRDLVRMLARTDEALARDIRHRLAFFGGPSRWAVEVSHGEATIIDRFDSETDRHVALVLAEGVPGVLRARCVATGALP